MRRQTTKSIKKFLKNCIAKVACSANKKCSGARLEVSRSRVAGRGEVGKWNEMGVKENCYVHRRLQCNSRCFGKIFLHFYNFQFFYPKSACPPFKKKKSKAPRPE